MHDIKGQTAMAATDAAPNPAPNRDRVSAHAIARLRTFIEGECSDFRQGQCLVADGPCRIITRQQPCRYFEVSVLPIGRTHPTHNPGATKAAEVYAAIAPHTLADLNATPEPRACPDCGETLPARRRVCDPCGKKRRSRAYREAARKRRSEYTVNLKMRSKTSMIAGCLDGKFRSLGPPIATSPQMDLDCVRGRSEQFANETIVILKIDVAVSDVFRTSDCMML